MTANKRDSGVNIVHGCFPEKGNSIVSVFFWEPLPAKWKPDRIKIPNLSSKATSEIFILDPRARQCAIQ